MAGTKKRPTVPGDPGYYEDADYPVPTDDPAFRRAVEAWLMARNGSGEGWSPGIVREDRSEPAPPWASYGQMYDRTGGGAAELEMYRRQDRDMMRRMKGGK